MPLTMRQIGGVNMVDGGKGLPRSPQRGAAFDDAPEASRSATVGFVAAILVACLVGAGLVWHDSGADPPDAQTPPALVPTPEGLVLPSRTPAQPIAVAAGTAQPSPRRVAKAVKGLASDATLGSRVGLWVASTDGEVVYRQGPQRALVPASTMKMLTTTAALAELGPGHVFRTSVVRSGRRLTLVAGGDPYLAASNDAEPPLQRASLQRLAARSAKALAVADVRRVRLGYDTSLFDDDTTSPTWPDSYLSEFVVSPITALWVDRGRVAPDDAFDPRRYDDPAAYAAGAFAQALSDQGVEVVGPIRRRVAPATSTTMAQVESDTLDDIAARVLEVSDNEAAEVLAHHVAVARGETADFEGAGRAVTGVLAELGVRLKGAEVLDGSGLSRANRLRPSTLIDILTLWATAAPESGFALLASALPVAGFNGSLAERFTDATSTQPGLGWVRAKTGTLSGVNALAGLVQDTDGTMMLVAALTDDVALTRTLDARDQLDRIFSALAACRCGG